MKTIEDTALVTIRVLRYLARPKDSSEINESEWLGGCATRLLSQVGHTVPMAVA